MNRIKGVKNSIQAIEKIIAENGQLCLLLIITSVWCIVFHEYLFFRKAFVFDKFAIDTLSQFYPIEYFRLKNLLSGSFPFWSFQFDLGIDVYSLMANTNPFDLIFLLFGPDHFTEAIPLVVLLKFLAAGLFFHAFLCKLNIEPVAAIIGALLFTFSGYMLINSHWYHYTNYAVFIALFLYCFELWFQHGRWFPLVMVLGVVALKGELQLFQMGCFGAVYVLYRSINRFGWSWRLLQVYSWLAFFFVIGLLISAYVLLPNIAAIFSSSRVESAVNDISALDRLIRIFEVEQWSSLHIFLVRFFSSDMLGSWIWYKGVANYFEDSTLYIGLLSVLLFPAALAMGKKESRLLWMFPVTVLIICCFPYFRNALNGFASGTFKYQSLFCAFFALFSTVTILDKLFSSTLTKRSAGVLQRLAIVLLVVLGISLVLYVLEAVINQDKMVINHTAAIRTFIFCGCYLFVLAFVSPHKVRWGKYVLLLLVIVEVTLSSAQTVGQNPGKMIPFFNKRGENYFNPQTLTALYHLRELDDSFYRIEKGYNDGHLNDPLVQNYFGTQAYFGFVSAGIVDFYRNLELSLDSPRLASYRYGMEKRDALQSLLGVKYFLCRTDKECEGLEGFSLLDTTAGVKIYRNRHTQPFGRIFYQQLSKSDLCGFSLGEKDAILRQAVVTEEKVPGVSEFSGESGNVHIHPAMEERANGAKTMDLSSWSNERFQGRVSTQEPGVLFFPVPFDPGWSVDVNGTTAELVRLNFGFSGVVLPRAGSYAIDLKYTPPLLHQSLAVSCVALLFALLLRLKFPVIRIESWDLRTRN